MFERLLLGRLRADRDQTRQDGQGRANLGAYGIGCHGNHLVHESGAELDISFKVKLHIANP